MLSLLVVGAAIGDLCAGMTGAAVGMVVTFLGVALLNGVRG
jgi:hypothetical protein